YPLRWLLEHPFQQDGSAEIVRADIASDLIHRLSHADFGSEVDHRVDAGQGSGHGAGVTHIAVDELDIVGQFMFVGTVHLIDESVENTHLHVPVDQFGDDVTADEAGAAGYEDALHWPAAGFV